MSIIVQRIKKRWMVKTTTQRMLVNPRKTKETSIRRTNPKTKVQRKEINLSNVIVVVVLIILPRSAIYPQHLVDMYQKSLKEAGKTKGSYEAHFNATSDEATTTSAKRLDEATKSSLTVEDYIDGENLIVKYNPNDMFGVQDYASFILIDFI
jgi:hypothetical protein